MQELVPLYCADCRLPVCLNHRDLTHHACEGKPPSATPLRAVKRFLHTFLSHGDIADRDATLADSVMEF